DPLFHLLHHAFSRLAVWRNWFAYRDRHLARSLDKGILWPAFAGVQRNRYYLGIGVNRQARAAALVLALRTDHGAGPFGEHDNPLAAAQALLSNFGHHAEGIFTLFAVDRNHAQQGDAPAEEGDVQDLLLEHEHQGARGVRQQEDGLPRRLVLGEHD